jgi:proline iminopeptidase
MVHASQNLRSPLTPLPRPVIPISGRWKRIFACITFPGVMAANVLIIHSRPGLPFREPMSGLEPLTGEYRFQYYDQRGCGKSTRPFDRFESSDMYTNMTNLDRTLGLRAQLADIERIRQILGDDKLILIGHSWGGFLASLYAAEFLEHVQALILVSPAAALVMPQDDEKFAMYYLSVVDIPSDGMIQHGEPGGWMSWGMYTSMGQRHDYRAVLKQVSAPVLVLHGANDLQSEAASRQCADLFPNARFVVLPNASHFAFEQQPQAFDQVVGDFLKNMP